MKPPTLFTDTSGEPFAALLLGGRRAATVDVRRDWSTALSGLFGGRSARMTGVAWAAVLFPTLVVPSLAFPDDVWELYRSVTWDGPLTACPTEVITGADYVSARDGTVEMGVWTEAVSDAGSTARSFAVIRTAGEAVSFGIRSLPAAPPEVVTERGVSLVIDNASITSYLEIADLHHPLVDSTASAQRWGLPNQLVPSGLLLAAVLRDHDGDQGQIEMWFRHPVPAGALINIGETNRDGMIEGNVTLPSTRETSRFRMKFEDRRNGGLT